MGAIRHRLNSLLAKGWRGAQCDPPRLWPGDRRQIARRAFDATGLARGCDLVQLAKALGIKVVCMAVRGCGGELTDGNIIIYRWHPDERVRRERVAHGLAHALLVREKWEHSETDALLLTLDFC